MSDKTKAGAEKQPQPEMELSLENDELLMLARDLGKQTAGVTVTGVLSVKGENGGKRLTIRVSYDRRKFKIGE